MRWRLDMLLQISHGSASTYFSRRWHFMHSVYSRTEQAPPIFVEICSYLTDIEQKISWHVSRHDVYEVYVATTVKVPRYIDFKEWNLVWNRHQTNTAVSMEVVPRCRWFQSTRCSMKKTLYFRLWRSHLLVDFYKSCTSGNKNEHSTISCNLFT